MKTTSRFWALLVGALLLLTTPVLANAGWQARLEVTVPSTGQNGAFLSKETFSDEAACKRFNEDITPVLLRDLKEQLGDVEIDIATSCSEVAGEDEDDVYKLIAETLREMSRKGGFGHQN